MPSLHLRRLISRHEGIGTVYFGWLGTLIGLISICAGAVNIWGDINKTGPALAITLLTLFYGYILKPVTLTYSTQE